MVMGDEDIHIRLSASSFDSACSSLAHLYHDCHIDREVVSKDLWTKLGTYKKGSRREVAQERKKLGLSMTEEKKTSAICGLSLSGEHSFQKRISGSCPSTYIPSFGMESDVPL